MSRRGRARRPPATADADGARDRTAEAPDDVVPRRPDDPPAPRLDPAWWIAIALAALYPVAFAAVAVLRMSYPFDLEWMEGGMLGHVQRLLEGHPLYVTPRLEFTPFIYPPLYFHVAAFAARVLGEGLLPLRLVSFVSALGAMGFVYAIVRRGQRSRVPALLAACLFAACYREGGAWLDLARVDSLYMLLALAGLYALRREEAPLVSGLAGGVLLSLAFLTKQTAAATIAPALLALLLVDWRRALPFAAAVALVAGGGCWWLQSASDGWFGFYVFELPRHHPIIGQLLRGFWIDDLVGPVGIALAIGAFHFFVPARVPSWRLRVFDGAVLVGLVLAGYLTRVRVGSYDNVVLPAYLGAALAFGFGLNALAALRAGAAPGARVPVERFVAFLCVVQFALLAYKPWGQIPPAADVAAGRQTVESLARVPADVWVPYHPHLAVMAGKPRLAHDLAVRDVLRQGAGAASDSLLAEIRGAVRAQRFGVIVLDGEVWMREEIEPYYARTAKMFAREEQDLFWAATGYHTRPDDVWTPRTDVNP